MANKKRLIDANEYPCLKCEAYGCGKVCSVLQDWLDNAMEVVPCEMCKFAVGHDEIHKTVLCQQRSAYPMKWDDMPFDGFCSYGERREGK